MQQCRALEIWIEKEDEKMTNQLADGNSDKYVSFVDAEDISVSG